MRPRRQFAPAFLAIAVALTAAAFAMPAAHAQDSPTTINSGPVTWGAGGSVSFLVDKVDGTQGINWSLDNVTGPLTFSSSASADDTFTIDISSVVYGGDGQDTGAVGSATDWDSSKDYTWTFVHTTGGVVNYDPSAVTLDDSSFAANNNLNGGQFVLQLLNGGDDLAIHFTNASELPEPGTLALTLFGLTGYLRLIGKRKAK